MRRPRLLAAALGALLLLLNVPTTSALVWYDTGRLTIDGDELFQDADQPSGRVPGSSAPSTCSKPRRRREHRTLPRSRWCRRSFPTTPRVDSRDP